MAAFDVVDVAPPIPSICRVLLPCAEPIAESIIDAQREGEDGRSVCLMKRPFEVPERIHTAGRARRDGKRGRGLGCGKLLSVGFRFGRDSGEGFSVMGLDGMVLGGCLSLLEIGYLQRSIYVYMVIYYREGNAFTIRVGWRRPAACFLPCRQYTADTGKKPLYSSLLVNLPPLGRLIVISMLRRFAIN